MPQHLAITVESPAFQTEDVYVTSLEGEEAIGRLFHYRLSLATEVEDAIDADDLRGNTIAIVFHRGHQEARRVWGMVTEVVEDFEDGSHRLYEVVVAPRAHRLRLVHTQDILLDTSWPNVIAEKVERVGLSESLEMRLSASYANREYVVQFRETDLAFVSRLAEHVGISFFFEHDETSDRLVFTDHNDGFASHGADLPFQDFADGPGVHRLRVRTRVIPTNVVMQEYNYRTPTVDLTASTTIQEGAGGGHVEYGANYQTVAEGEAMAAIRAEEIRCGQLVYEGEASLPELSAGLRIKVTDHPRLGDVDLLVTEVHHSISQRSSGGRSGGRGSDPPTRAVCRFEAIPLARTYRPPRLTPRPRIAGFFVGLIQPTAEDAIGSSAEIDDQGRYHVRLMFDVQPRQGDVSRPIRMSQAHGGTAHGIHFPLRPGVEVAVGFADGDPDRPVILGALPNPITPSPTVQSNSRQNIISTRSGITITLRDNL